MLRKTIAKAMRGNLFGSSFKKAAITLIAARETQFNFTANENNASWNLFSLSWAFASKMDPMISICDWFMKWWRRRSCHSISSWIFPIQKCRRFPESVVRFTMRESERKRTVYWSPLFYPTLCDEENFLIARRWWFMAAPSSTIEIKLIIKCIIWRLNERRECGTKADLWDCRSSSASIIGFNWTIAHKSITRKKFFMCVNANKDNASAEKLFSSSLRLHWWIKIEFIVFPLWFLFSVFRKNELGFLRG